MHYLRSSLEPEPAPYAQGLGPNFRSNRSLSIFTAPHLTVAEIRGRSIMVHTGGDNYSDTPAPLGGGGARIACGVIK
jgi:Cu/Zn superoxide dismutase